MHSKQLIFTAAFSITITGMAFSQCVAPENSSEISSDHGEFVADTSMQHDDTSMQDGDTTMRDGDTTVPDSSDTALQDNDTLSMNSEDTTVDTSVQEEDTTIRGTDTSENGGDGSGIIPSFDPKTIDSLSGNIATMDTIISGNGEQHVQLSLKTPDGDTTTVFLAPESFLKDMNFDVKKGDSVSVVGSRTTDPQGNDVIVASKIIKDSSTYLLRDEKGTPFWPEQNQ